MSHIFLDRRDGRLALYLNGDLQFDRRDERLYHEPLALVPVALAARRAPGRPLRVLILGGGDGLALREILRFPEAARAHVVDRDLEVLRLGARELAGLNGGAFRDPRARVHAMDARDFLARARGFDVLICDLTFPRDVAGAALFTASFFRKVRAALRPGGVLAVNAVSPELTPQAFGCVGETLGAAGFWAVPYAFALPSFLQEGYGRWGFFFASSRPILEDELGGLRLPDGADLTAGPFLAGTQFPAAAEEAMEAAPNRSDELLYYLYNAAPLPWEGPLRPLRFAPPDRSGARRGPRLTAAQGFARWLSGSEGRHSLDELLACLPLSHRGQTREALLDWGQHAETLLQGIDLRAFIDGALRRARELPRAWVRELRELRDRIRDGLPSAGDLLWPAYRVLAILLLVLVLANLFFPDNLYAKGFTSSAPSRSVSPSRPSSSSQSFHYSDPTRRVPPFRYRVGGRSYASGYPRDRVYDAQGQEYPAQRFAFTDAQGGRQPISALLALSRDLQLFESGAVAYAAAVPGHRFLVEPGRLRVLDAAGREVLALLPGARLENEVKQQLRAQGPLIEKAIADHRRWVDWTRWASMTAGARQAASELAALEAIKQAVASAEGAWANATPGPGADPGRGWFPIFPGVYLEPPKVAPATRAVAFVTLEGTIRTRPLVPPAALTDEDRFLFWVLNRRVAEGRDPSLGDLVARWAEIHGQALGLKPAPPSPAGRRS